MGRVGADRSSSSDGGDGSGPLRLDFVRAIWAKRGHGNMHTQSGRKGLIYVDVKYLKGGTGTCTLSTS
jgi:hypothetical protein